MTDSRIERIRAVLNGYTAGPGTDPRVPDALVDLTSLEDERIEMVGLLDEWDNSGYSFDGLEPIVVKTRALLTRANGVAV